MSDVLAAIRDLHAPVADFSLYCGGCDIEGWDADCPAWPCRTAQLVYTAEEITALTEQAREQMEAFRQKRDAERQGQPSLVPEAWTEQLAQQLRAGVSFQRLFGDKR